MMFQVLLRVLYAMQYFGNEFSSSDLDSNNLTCNEDF